LGSYIGGNIIMARLTKKEARKQRMRRFMWEPGDLQVVPEKKKPKKKKVK